MELLAASAGKATLEPMLWNVPLLLVLHKILDDKTTHSPTSPHHNLARFAKYDNHAHTSPCSPWASLLSTHHHPPYSPLC